MTQDLFIPPCAEEIGALSASLSEASGWGIDWQNLADMWLTAFSRNPVAPQGWALFISVNTDYPEYVKERIGFDLFLLKQGEHPVWYPGCPYRPLVRATDCPGWADFSESLDALYRSRPTDLPFGFGDEAEWFVDCMINKVALDTMQKIAWAPEKPIGNWFVSPNTGQDVFLKPLHPSGGHLFAASRGDTYESAVNFAIAHSEHLVP